MDFSKILSALKFAPHVLLGVAVASAIVHFGPGSFTAALGLDTLLSTHRAWIGGAFLLSAVIFISALSARFSKLIGPALIDTWNTRQHRKGLHYLTPPEKVKLSEYIGNNTSTRSFPISDGVIGGLVGKKILYMASNVGHPGGMSFPYNLQPWAWQYLTKHPELLGGPGPSADADL